jgi:enterochelin esterase family protein
MDSELSMLKSLSLLLVLLACSLAPAQTELTARSLKVRLQSGPLTPEMETPVRKLFGDAALREGKAIKTDGLDVLWAIEAAGAKVVTVYSEDRTLNVPLQRLGTSDLFLATSSLPDGTGLRWGYTVDGRAVGSLKQLELYVPHPDALAQEGVTKGRILKQEAWQSKIFAGTTRDWWIYVPEQYTPDKPACLMVFQDGQWARGYIPPAFDNLIAKGQMPVTIGLFITPGTFADGRSNRSFEYDTLSDQYVRFLLEEMLPEVEKTYKLRQEPEARAIAGNSSGGICAFTAAWERPDKFGKVMSWIGSFVNLARGKTLREGGHNYPALIRAVDKKPIRVFLQDGKNDLDNPFGNWWLANLQMERALAYKGYDYTFVGGNGFHSDAHGRAILPEALKWLWRDVK